MLPSKPTRLNKYLVEVGLAASRRKADELITDGRVSINGMVGKLGATIKPDDNVLLDGNKGFAREDIIIAFNKPAGYICSHARQASSPTIFDLLPESFGRLKIAGRLDKDSEGLMILSSDGELIHQLSHPRFEKEKEYLVDLDKPLQSSAITLLTKGVKLTDGLSRFVHVAKINPTKLRVILLEGRNRQIRRSFTALGYEVLRLQRLRIGKYELRSLPSGKHVFIHQAKEILG